MYDELQHVPMNCNTGSSSAVGAVYRPATPGFQQLGGKRRHTGSSWCSGINFLRFHLVKIYLSENFETSKLSCNFVL